MTNIADKEVIKNSYLKKSDLIILISPLEGGDIKIFKNLFLFP